MHLFLRLVAVTGLLSIVPLNAHGKPVVSLPGNPLRTIVSPEDLKANEAWIKYENDTLLLYPQPSLVKIIAYGVAAGVVTAAGAYILCSSEKSGDPKALSKPAKLFYGLGSLAAGGLSFYAFQKNLLQRLDQTKPILKIDAEGIVYDDYEKILWGDITYFEMQKKENDGIESNKVILYSAHENRSFDLTINCNDLPITFKQFITLIRYYLDRREKPSE